MLSKSKARCDTLIRAEQLADKIRAIALPAAMQKHDVVRQMPRAVEKLADRC